MASGNGQWPLPEGWVEARLGDIATLVGGGTPSRETPDYFGGDVLWLTPTEIPKTTVALISDSHEKLTELGLTRSSARLLPPGAVLLTSRASIGYVAIAGKELTTNQGFASFICEDGVYNYYLAYWLKANKELLEENATGTTFKEISKSKLREFTIPLAPLPDQHRIVAEIEKQFTRLDAAVAALRRAKANLARYKAAVLKAAVEGRLVAQDPADEPAGALLGRILAERRAQWEAANPKKKYVEPKGPEVAGLGELPVGWVWATVEQLAAHEPQSITDGPFGSKLKTEHYTESGPRVIRLQNIGDGEFVDAIAHISEEHYHFLKRHSVFAGDLVIAGLGVNLPRACIIPDHVGPAIVKADCIRFKPHPGIADTHYLNAALNSEPLRKYATTIVHGVGRPRLNQEEIKLLVIPIPPLRQQVQIAEEIDRHLSVIQATERMIDANLTRAERLRQGVLGKAFRGELV